MTSIAKVRKQSLLIQLKSRGKRAKIYISINEREIPQTYTILEKIDSASLVKSNKKKREVPNHEIGKNLFAYVVK